ncbi:MAG: hypothetical protein J6M35_00140, partial [Clostridia bacterium]|nr:hypothetical protein [Clostridia bacterium]
KVLVELFQKLAGFQGGALNRGSQASKSHCVRKSSFFASFFLAKEKKNNTSVTDKSPRYAFLKD